MYLGALAIGADITSGYFAFHYLQKHGKSVSIIFKDFHANFHKRAMGDTVFTCNMGSEIKDMIEEAVKTKKRINLPVVVNATIPTISKESIATFSLTLSVKAR